LCVLKVDCCIETVKTCNPGVPFNELFFFINYLTFKKKYISFVYSEGLWEKWCVSSLTPFVPMLTFFIPMRCASYLHKISSGVKSTQCIDYCWDRDFIFDFVIFFFFQQKKKKSWNVKKKWSLKKSKCKIYIYLYIKVFLYIYVCNIISRGCFQYIYLMKINKRNKNE